MYLDNNDFSKRKYELTASKQAYDKPKHRLVSYLDLYIKLEIIEIRTISRGGIKCYCRNSG